MTKQHVEQREGAYRIAGTRVSLDPIVYAFLRGASPESIAQSFPVLKLEEVYGAITYYLGHQADVDSLLQQRDRLWEGLCGRARNASPALCSESQQSTKTEKVS